MTNDALASLLDNYARNFDRSSEAVCRTAIDFILNECLTVMVSWLDISLKTVFMDLRKPQKGNNSEAQVADDKRPRTPKPWDDIRVYGELSLTHKIPSRTTTFFPSGIVVSGRVDHGIGRVLKSRAKNAPEQLKRRFHSLLLIVEAKFERSVDQALPQLLVYLASLHQSRLQRKRSDASVYGLASDGYVFIFVTISHEGMVKLSRRFDILQGDMRNVLGCLKYILEKTADMSPILTPDRNGGGQKQCDVDGTEDADDLIALDDNEFLNPPNGEEDEGEDAA
jgi:hypothetical protein